MLKQKSKTVQAAYIVGILGLIGVIIPKIFDSFKDSESKASIIIENHYNNNNDKKETNYFNKNKAIAVEKKLESKGNSKVSEKEVFKIIGISNQKLIENLKKTGLIEIKSNSLNSINVFYTGNITQLFKDTNSYYYDGGFIKINVDNNCIIEFEEYKIDQIRANPKALIENHIQNVINNYIEKNTVEITNKILTCLNQ